MSHYCGITTDLATRKAQHEQDHPYLRAWTVANNGQPFVSRAAAQAWENRQPGEHHPGGAPGLGPWYGYCFDA